MRVGGTLQRFSCSVGNGHSGLLVEKGRINESEKEVPSMSEVKGEGWGRNCSCGDTSQGKDGSREE